MTVPCQPVRHVGYSYKAGRVRMTSPTAPRAVYVNSQKEAALTCPSCHNTKLVNFAPYLNDKSPIKAQCLCGCIFAVPDVVIESRKFLAKKDTPPRLLCEDQGVNARGRWKRRFEFSILQRSGGRQTHVHQRWRGPRALPREAQGLYPPYYGPQFDVDANCAFGPPEVCAARLQGFLDAGAKTVMLGQPGPTWSR